MNIGAETEQIEFKKSTGETKEGVISICSILNKHGSGDLYFGVKNNGDVIGQEIGESSMRDVSRAIRENIKPAIYPVVEMQQYGDLRVIHVRFEGNHRPYLAYKIPYIRIADEDSTMDQTRYNEMLHERENLSLSWESQISKYHISDIDQKVFEKYLRKAKEVGRISFENDSPSEVLTKLDLTEGDTLLNAGAALFVDSGINDLQMAKFATNEKVTFTDIRRYTGSIIGLVDIAMQYLIDAMDWRVEFHGKLERDEIPEIPVDALREAVVNAFAHRQIESRQSIQIMIFKNRIEIYSPGTFPEKTSPEEFAEGNKKAIRRNKIITQTLYYSKDMETFATGLMKIKKLCTEAGVRFEFQREEYGFTVVFYRHCGEGWGWSAEQGKTELPSKNERSLKEVLKEVLKEADYHKVETIIELIDQKGSITPAEARKICGKSDATTWRYLNMLTETGFVIAEGNTNNTVYRRKQAKDNDL